MNSVLGDQPQWFDSVFSHVGSPAVRVGGYEGAGVVDPTSMPGVEGLGEPCAPSHKGSDSCFCHETRSGYSETFRADEV